ncbi:hypothetical protein WAI453_012863 [Rhynchosporium graminicola]
MRCLAGVTMGHHETPAIVRIEEKAADRCHRANLGHLTLGFCDHVAVNDSSRKFRSVEQSRPAPVQTPLFNPATHTFRDL